MPQISLFNSKGRDAAVMAESVRVPVRIRWLDAENRQAASARILKGTVDRDYEALLAGVGTPEKVAEALIGADPEIDPESVGSILRDTARVYINTDRQTVHRVSQIEIVRNPDGTEKLRRPRKAPMPNVNAGTAAPLERQAAAQERGLQEICHGGQAPAPAHQRPDI